MIFVVDNYDSFTWNLVQALGRLDPEIEVARNDRFDPEAVARRRPAAVVISPGPGRPEEAGRSMELIGVAVRERLPLLGVCLGHQAIGAFCGARVERAAPRHGRSSRVSHDGRDLFDGLPNPFDAARYHSLVVREEGLPAPLEVRARSDDGLVMGLSHRAAPVYGVQFHPESVLTPHGEKLLANFIALAAASASRSPEAAGRGKERRS
jgi:anthranilate synthase component II